MRKNILLFSFLLTFFLSACGPDYMYNHRYALANEEWTYRDTFTFEVDIQDTLKIFNLYLELVHSTEFAYQNLYTNIYTRFPSAERIKKLLSLELADKTGLWNGKCGSSYCSLRIPIQEGAFFNALGKHVFTLEQYMRKNPLPGIKSLALIIEDTGQVRQ